MHYCYNCGELISSNQNFCVKCGIKIKPESIKGLEKQFIDGSIRISSKNIIIGPAKYFTKDINTVSWTKIDKMPASTKINGIIGGAIIGWYWGFSDMDGWDYLLLALGVFLLISAIVSSFKNTFYTININTSFGDTSIYETDNKEKAHTIVEAINAVKNG